MRFLRHLIYVHDIYFVSEKLKEFNPNFALFYNTQKKWYEIHDTGKSNSYVISFKGYPSYNLIIKLIKTKRENMKKLFEEIEIENNKLLMQATLSNVNDAKDMLSEVFNFASKKAGELTSNCIKKIIQKET